jgi:Flp pilus assembly protein TadG
MQPVLLGCEVTDVRLRNLLRDERGNTAIIFGLAAVPLIALGGGIVDFAHRAQIRGELQSAADTAAIAAARVVQLAELGREEDQDAVNAKAVEAATRILNAALATFGGMEAAVFDVDVGGEVISISADLDVPTSFLGVIGINQLKAKASAEVNLPDPIVVEVAMVLDYSGSMLDDDKYVRMTAAGRDFIAKVDKDRGETSQIGIVPFSEYVYTPIATSNIRDTGSGYYDHGDDGGGWGGWGGGSGTVTTCLLNRDYPYSATDQTPSSGMPASQWPQGDDTKCDEYGDANLRVRDLTDEFSGLADALSAMQPVGLTNISLGMEMGWHLLTPPSPFQTARDFSDEHVQKIIILLTDGRQTVPAMGPGGDVSTDAANETTAELCDGAKAEGIRIFSIAYDVDDPVVEALLLNCASGDQAYFDASVSEISDVFEEIYSQISESVWLSR